LKQLLQSKKIYLLAFFCLFVYVFLFTPAIPIADQWETPLLFSDFSIKQIFTHHNEHLIAIPKMIYFFLARLTHWNVKAEAVLSLVFLFFTIMQLRSAYYKNVPNEISRTIFSLFLLAMFSPLHYENILWGWQLQMTFAAWMISIAFTNINRMFFYIKNFVFSVSALIAASLSFLTGIMAWLPVLLFALVRGWRRKIFFAVFLVLMIIVFCVYFLGYKSSSPFSFNVLNLIKYFFVYMGAIFIPTYKTKIFLDWVLVFSGALGLILLILGGVLFNKTRKYSYSETNIPYLCMIFSLFVALSTAFARNSEGLSSALLSRYHIFQMFYLVGLVWLLLIYLTKIERLRSLYMALVFFFYFILIVNWSVGIGIGINKINKYRPIENDLKINSENISDSNSEQIYYSKEALRCRIKIVKEKKYNVFYWGESDE